MVQNGLKNSPKLPKIFYCDLCDYTSYHKGDFNKHNLTIKHTMFKNVQKTHINSQIKGITTFTCECSKVYKYNSCLTRHKLVCKKNVDVSPAITHTVLQLLKTNQEIVQDNKNFKQQIIALTEKNITPPVHNITNNNTQNNVTFNLNYFLNTTCKNAINMKDFIESINVNFTDLENTGKNGFVKSMTHVITRELGKLDACMRPIHCSDVKRKVLHIKNENEWRKDTEQCVNAKKMVGSIAHKTNVLQIPKWVTANPQSQLYDDKLNDLYFKIVGNSMDGSDETYEKIITGVSGKIHVGDNKPQILLLK